MSTGWTAEGWSWNTSDQNSGQPNQSAVGWGIGDSGWGATETSVGDTNTHDNQHKVTAGPKTFAPAAIGWGSDNGWGVTEAGSSKNQYKAAVERKTSSSGLDPSPISPKEEPRRSLTLDLHVPATKELYEASRSVSVTPTEMSSIISASRSVKSSDPAHALRTTLRTLQQAVRRQTEYDQASAELDQWRRTRNSEEFARATTATRKKLETRRIEIGQRQLEAEKKLKLTLDGLAELPDLSAAHLARVQYAVNEAEMWKFHNELKEWIQQASQHPVMQKKEPEPPEEPKEKSVTPEDPFSRDPNDWSLDDIRSAFVELENRLGGLSDQVYSEDYTSLRDEVQSELEARREQLQGSFGTGAQVLIAQCEEQQQRVENALSDRAERVAALLQERTRLKGELLACQTLQGSLDTTLGELNSLLEQVERSHPHDEQELVALTSLIQSELLTPRAPPQVTIVPDELLPPLLHSIIPCLQHDVLPIIETFTSEFLKHNRESQVAVKEASDIITNKVDGMKINAQALMSMNKA